MASETANTILFIYAKPRKCTSASRRMTQLHLSKLFALDLHGKFQHRFHRTPGGFLLFFRLGVSHEKPATDIHVPPFIRLNMTSIELGRLCLTCAFAELDELFVLFQRKRFAREVRAGDSLDSR